MHKRFLTLCLATVMVTAAPLVIAADPANPAMDRAGHSDGSMELHRIMEEGRTMLMPAMSGDVDKDFATLMTMHHQQAIEMNAVLLKHGKQADLRALAQKMADAQKKEIEQMEPYTK